MTDIVTTTLPNDVPVVRQDVAGTTTMIVTMTHLLLLVLVLDMLLDVQENNAVVVATMTETTIPTLPHLVATASVVSQESRKF